MKVKELIGEVLEKTKGKVDGYLVHFFKMYEKEENEKYQVGFYNPEHDKVIPIEFDGEIKIGEESPVFKEGGKIDELDIDKVEIDIQPALNKAMEIQKLKYPGQEPIKIILVLQNHDGIMYNITYVTQSFKTLNIKIDATDGTIISDNLTTIFDFKKGDANNESQNTKN